MLAAPPLAAQTSSGYVKLEGCSSSDDEASRAGYADWSPLTNISFGATNLSPDLGGGAGSARTELSAISLIKKFDGCTTSLFRWAMQGRHIDRVEAVVLGSAVTGGPRVVLLRIRLENVVVTKASYGPAQEAVNLAFQRITIEHLPTRTTVTYDHKTILTN